MQIQSASYQTLNDADPCCAIKENKRENNNTCLEVWGYIGTTKDRAGMEECLPNRDSPA